MRRKAPQAPRHLCEMFIPGRGRLIVPPEVVDREGPAMRSGATRLFVGNFPVWSRPVTPGAHLAVVRG